MNTYVTGATIKRLRENNHMTQAELAEKLAVSDKTVSKWETAKGLPDISLIEGLAKALKVSVIELMSGDYIINQNVSSNMLRSKLYVCPICGNILHATGNALIGCCGITLPPLEAETVNEAHEIHMEKVEDETFISIAHSMTKAHYISFAAYANSDTFHVVKFYPEGNAETRLKIRGGGILYIFCNKHGLMKQKL